MKKIIILMALFLITADGFSQIGIGIGSGGFGMGMNIPINHKNAKRTDRIENQVQQLKHDLNLNEDQVVQVRNLFIERDRKRQRKGNEAMTGPEFDKRMQEILTAEQYTKYSELKQQKREEKKESKKDNKKETVPESEWDDVYR